MASRLELLERVRVTALVFIANPVKPLKEPPSRVREMLTIPGLSDKVPVPENVPFRSIVTEPEFESAMVGLAPRGKLQLALMVVAGPLALLKSRVTKLKVMPAQS